MGDDRKRSEVVLDVGAGRTPASGTPREDTPFRVLLLGDFSGPRGAAQHTPLGQRRVTRVDRDDFDDVMARLQPAVALDEAGRVLLRFESLEDFHPDRIFARLPQFQELRQLRQRLADPATFRDAVKQLGVDEAASGSPAGARRPAGSILEQMVGGPLAPAEEGPVREDDVREFARRAVAPFLVAGADPRQAPVLERLDAAIAEGMRAVLHHPRLQALEALWRTLWLLTRRLDTGSELQLALLDASLGELETDLAAGTVQETALYRLVVSQTTESAGGEPWAVMAGAYGFDASDAGLATLARLGELAALAGAPFIANASAELCGFASFAALPEPAEWRREAVPAWDALRRSPVARSLGLAAPGFLLRELYGAATEPCELFRFEEVAGAPRHGDLLWGSASFACALLLAQTFAEAGWAMRPGMIRELGGLPLPLVQVPGGTEAVPVAEVQLTERAAQYLMERGIMPLASLKGSDAVQVVRFQSVAQPAAALAGRWVGAPA